MPPTTNIPISSINISTRTRKSLGDIQSLANNIGEIGLLSPIIINRENKLLAGERRLRACELLGWDEIPAIIKETSNAEQDLRIEISENVNRKDFTLEELVNSGIELERIESVKAQERLLSTQNNNAGRAVKENFPELEKGQSRDKVGKELGVSGKQYERLKFIVLHKDFLSPGEYDDWNNRRISTNRVYTTIKELVNSSNAAAPTNTAPPNVTEKPKEIIKEVVKNVEVKPSDYDEIKKQNEDFKKRNSELTAKVSKLGTDKRNLETDKRNLETENRNLQTEKSKLEATKLELETKKLELEEALNEIQSENPVNIEDELLAEISDLNSQVRQLKEERNILEKVIGKNPYHAESNVIEAVSCLETMIQERFMPLIYNDNLSDLSNVVRDDIILSLDRLTNVISQMKVALNSGKYVEVSDNNVVYEQ